MIDWKARVALTWLTIFGALVLSGIIFAQEAGPVERAFSAAIVAWLGIGFLLALVVIWTPKSP